MALVLKDRVKETTTTTSTGTYTLAGAVTGYQSFSVVGDGNTTYYTVTDGTNWEVGVGTYTLSGTTLSRDTILASSNSGNAVSWSAGSKDVFLTYPADRSVYVDGPDIVPATTASYSGNVTTIQLRNSSTPSAVPTALSLSAGELVVNTADGKLYFKDSSNAVQVLAQINQVTTGGTQTLTNKTITNLIFDGDFTEEVFTITDGASVDLDPSNGTIQLWTLGASRSPTATGFAAGQSMTLMVNDGTAYTITWPSVTWVGGSAPTLATTGFTVIELWKVSTTLYGALVGSVA
jgi:hypothetical protein